MEEMGEKMAMQWRMIAANSALSILELFFSGRRARVLRAVVLWPPQRRGGLDTILPRKSRCFAPFIRKQGHIHHPSPLPFTVLPALQMDASRLLLPIHLRMSSSLFDGYL